MGLYRVYGPSRFLNFLLQSLLVSKGRIKYLDELFVVWDADSSDYLEGGEIMNVIAKYNAAVR